MEIGKKIVIFILAVMFIVNITLKIKIKNVNIIGNDKVTDAEILTEIFESENDISSVVFLLKSKSLVLE